MEKLMNQHLPVVLFMLLILGLLTWWLSKSNTEPAVEFITQEEYTVPPPMVSNASPITFEDVSAWIDKPYAHYNGKFRTVQNTPSRYMPETMGPGVVLFDFDNDRDVDIFVTNSSDFKHAVKTKTQPTQQLYRNDGAKGFVSVVENSGLDITAYAMGAVAADYDGDTLNDLLITMWGGVKLFRNLGHGKFEDKSHLLRFDEALLDDEPDWSTGALFFDADGDQDLDIFIANYVQWSPDNDVYSSIDGKNKSYATPNLYEGSTSKLLLQEAGHFVDRTEVSGILTENGKALGVALWDFNEDGRMDIVVSNDTQPNNLFLNMGDGRFEERALQVGIAYDENGKTRAGMGIDVAYYNNDAQSAIAIGNFSREPVSFFKKTGDGFYREYSQQSGVATPTYRSLTFGLRFGDYDLDGWQDLVLANGHIEPTISDVEEEITYPQSMILLGNNKNGQFVDWTESAGAAFRKERVARGLATADLDADGDLDIVVGENNGQLHILRNNANTRGNHYLRITLQGQTANTNAIGAKVTVSTGDVQQIQYVRTGSSYLSQSEFTLTFGLGQQAQADTITVTWPDGSVQRYNNTPADIDYVIDQTNGLS